jgi:hypothetical protein
MTDLQNHLFKTYFPYLVCFLLGVLVAWKGCGSGKVKTETVTIEKPVPIAKYIDRWKTEPVRHVETKVITVHDTIYQRETVSRLDTLFLIDTVKIVEAWLTEVQKYDTTATFEGADIRLRWQNYQNLTENLRVDYTPKKVPLKWALGVHANAGLISDFQTRYTPLFGLGLQISIKRSYIAADYGFNGDHYIGVRYGRNIISR